MTTDRHNVDKGYLYDNQQWRLPCWLFFERKVLYHFSLLKVIPQKNKFDIEFLHVFSRCTRVPLSKWVKLDSCSLPAHKSIRMMLFCLTGQCFTPTIILSLPTTSPFTGGGKSVQINFVLPEEYLVNTHFFCCYPNGEKIHLWKILSGRFKFSPYWIARNSKA